MTSSVLRMARSWFSDPHYGINTDYEGGKQTPELPPTLYRFDPRDGCLTVVADDFDGPNGLAFSPDGRRLYVAECGAQFAPDPVRHIRVFDVLGGGERLSRGRIFYKITPGFADGFRVDEDGNVWSAAADGVHCIAPDGTKLGAIKTPFPVSNLCFGGRNRSQLFICASHSLYILRDLYEPARRPEALKLQALKFLLPQRRPGQANLKLRLRLTSSAFGRR